MVNVFVAGFRVRLTVDFQILNVDLIPAGVTGVVVSATPEQFAVRLDEHRPGLDAWNNEVRLYPGDAPDHNVGHSAGGTSSRWLPAEWACSPLHPRPVEPPRGQTQ